MPTEIATAIVGATAEITLTALDAAGIESQAEADALIGDVLRLADDWHCGELPIEEVEKLTTAKERFLAARFVRPHPPALEALFVALILRSGCAFDGHGCVVEQHRAASIGHRITYVDGVRQITFTATADELRRGKPEAKPTDRSGLAQRSAWRTGLPAGDE
jgi:hypothetical protein